MSPCKSSRYGRDAVGELRSSQLVKLSRERYPQLSTSCPGRGKICDHLCLALTWRNHACFLVTISASQSQVLAQVGITRDQLWITFTGWG